MHWFTRSAIVVALAVPTVVASSGGVAHAAPDCSRTLVVGVRGSGETQADFNGFGRTVATAIVGAQFAQGAATTNVPVDYPALPLSVLFQPNGLALYLASVHQGVAAMLTTLAAATVVCPAQPIVLFGYSQGAMVVHEGLVDLQTASTSILQRVAGVGLIADPLRLGGQPYEIGTASPAKEGIALAAHVAPPTDLPPAVRPRSISVCNDGDPVCAFDLGNFQPAVHTSYATNGSAFVVGVAVGHLALVPGAPTSPAAAIQDPSRLAVPSLPSS